jgi:ABC-2 type transport system ATP-binding protein
MRPILRHVAQPWFIRRRTGWGWRPIAWQGWLVTLIAVGLAVRALVVLRKTPAGPGALLVIVAMYMLIGRLTGAAPEEAPSGSDDEPPVGNGSNGPGWSISPPSAILVSPAGLGLAGPLQTTVADCVLEFDRLSKRYGEVVALQDLSFKVRAGELFGFVGSNGAGKTTTMRIAMGVLSADAGEVRWAGAPITFETRRRIGYMPEERGLYPKMQVLEQLVYLAQLHGMPAATAQEAATRWLDRLGLAARVTTEVQALSHGNQQRVQLAAALIFAPEILILDEPFSGLDPVAVDVMSTLLREQARAGIPVVFSSHQLELVEQLCDRVGIIRHGRMVACGTVAELAGGSAERLWVDAPLAPADWTGRLPGATVRQRQGTRTLLELAPGCDDQTVLRAAIETGPVREFRRDMPSLSELFRHAVTEEKDA